jgi:hypothetical protein
MKHTLNFDNAIIYAIVDNANNEIYYEMKYCSLNNGSNTIFLETVYVYFKNMYIFVINCQGGLYS